MMDGLYRDKKQFEMTGCFSFGCGIVCKIQILVTQGATNFEETYQEKSIGLYHM